MPYRNLDFAEDAPFADSVVLRQPAAARQLSGIRSILSAWLEHRSIVPDTAEQLLLVMNEVVINAIDASSPDSSVTVFWSINDDVVCISARDGGTGFTYTKAEPVGPSSERGRGLTIVEALSDRVSATSDGQHTTVTTWTSVDRSDR